MIRSGKAQRTAAHREDSEVEGTDVAIQPPMPSIALSTRGHDLSNDLSAPARDVLCSTFSTSGLRRLCYPHYGIDPSTHCTLFRRRLNDIYLMSSPSERYALKVYQSEWRTPAAILGELEAIRHLASKGIDVVLPIARKDGHWITGLQAPEGRRSAVLFHWIDGKPTKWSDPTHSAQMGRLLADLHCAADDIPPNAARPQMSIDYLMEESLARIRRALEDVPLLNQRCEAIVERCRASLQRTSAPLEDWGLCHGDLFLNNARVKADRLVLLDFDWCGFGWRIFDLATFRWAARWYKSEHIAWRPFIDGYLQRRPRAANSLEFLQLFMVLRHLWHITQSIRTASLAGEYLLADGHLSNLISDCEQLENDPELAC
jgi:Ser/Thr protein kinase RdoA (MazF antagonist)